MRIIAGTLRGRRFNPPEGLGIRPTTDRAKEALFNILHHRFTIEGARVLDCYSGSGAIALEFLSRGAAHVTAVDMQRKATQYLENLLKALKLAQADVVTAQVEDYIAKTEKVFDYVFLDPPYALPAKDGLVNMLLARKCIAPEGQIVLEHPVSEDHSRHPHWADSRTYGLVAFTFFTAEAKI